MKKFIGVFVFLLLSVSFSSANVGSISDIQSWSLIKDTGRVIEMTVAGKNSPLWIWIPTYKTELPTRSSLLSKDGAEIQEIEQVRTFIEGQVFHLGFDKSGPVFGAWYKLTTQKRVSKLKYGRLIEDYDYEPREEKTVFILRRPNGRETSGTNLSIEDTIGADGEADYKITLTTATGVLTELWTSYFPK